MAYITDTKDVELEELELTPHFVIKSKIFTPYETFPTGSKLFINVCSNKKVPTRDLVDKRINKPITDFEPELIFMAISNVEWEIPILSSPQLREVLDKKGKRSLLIDCVINDKYMNWCMLSQDLKDILIQWCFDAVEFQVSNERGDFVIDRDDYVVPKRLFMGDELPLISVDLKHLNNVSKELEELNNDMNHEALNVIKAMDNDRDGDRDGELPALLPEVKRPGMIVELEEDDIVKHEEKKPKIREAEKPGFQLTFEKLDKCTKLKQDFQIKISSNLENYQDVKLNIDVAKKELFLLNHQDDVLYQTLLPLMIKCETISSFYVSKDKKLYIYTD